MSFVFAAKVRQFAEYQAMRGQDISDFGCILAAIFDDATNRAVMHFTLPRGFIYHHRDGWLILMRITIAILIELAPDPERALDALRSAMEDQPKEKPPEAESWDAFEFRLDRRNYKPPKELPRIDEEELDRFLGREAARAKRIVDAWRAGTDLERLPA